MSSALKEKLSLEASKMRWPCIYYSKLCWCIKVLKTFQIEPGSGTYSSAESLEYIRAKLLLLVHQSPKKLSITCRYANHGPKSSSENEQVCCMGKKYIENINISDCLFFSFFFLKKRK